MRGILTASGLLLLAGGCWDGRLILIDFDFSEGTLGWQAGFADYPAYADPGDLKLSAGLEGMPDELDICGTGYYIQGLNTSDDLFMYLTRRLGPEDGIEPNRTYRACFTVSFASKAPSGCMGIGGAPGESVLLKVGAAPLEPVAQLDGQGWYRLNVDKGNQSQGGAAASVAGNIANGIHCEDLENPDHSPHVLLTRQHCHDELVTASPDGELWLIVGTDSGFEGLTGLYYREINVRLSPAHAG
jgi:hypothetical protein